MSEDTEYAYMAARQAFEQARLDDDYRKKNEMGIVWGNDSGTSTVVEGHKIMEQCHDSFMLGPARIFQGSIECCDEYVHDFSS